MDFPRRMFELAAEFEAKFEQPSSMIGPRLGLLTAGGGADPAADENNPHALGGKRTFVPVLGEIVWEWPNAIGVSAPFSAYICRVKNGRRIGYARVPHYEYHEDSVNVFSELIDRFETTTAAMVFDQVNNPGGSIFHMYSILSALTNRPLVLPKHQLCLDENDAAMALQTVAKAEAGEAVPIRERPSTEAVAYSRFVLSEIRAGRRRLTNPGYLGGVAEILPAKIHYTKKIVVLINELTFSAPEFLAAILQDNGRATLFGAGTAGAGGCVRHRVIPNNLGIDYMTYTWTLAWRTNGQPIEGVGVQPDVRYSVTADDLQSGFTGYRQALLATIEAVCSTGVVPHGDSGASTRAKVASEREAADSRAGTGREVKFDDKGGD